MKWLCDTNVLSELFKKNPNLNIKDWLLKQKHISISIITVEEIYFGLNSINSKKHLFWFETFINSPECTVIPVDLKIAQSCGLLRAELKKRGKTRTQQDILIAATALIYGLTVVTRNTKDFEFCSVQLFNPF